MYNENNTKNTNGTKKVSKKTAGIIGAVAVIALAALFAGRTECDSCGKKFFGSGTRDIWDSSYVMCDECAQEYYSF